MDHEFLAQYTPAESTPRFDLSDETSVLFAIVTDGSGNIHLTNPYGEVLHSRVVTGETEEEMGESIMSGATSMIAAYTREL